MKTLIVKSLSIVAISAFMLSACSSDDDSDSDGNGDVPSVATFNFDTTDVSAYTRVDRMGMPAIATALISSKDDYNDANPTDDSAGTFVPEIITSLTTLHGALDEQLMGLGLTPCTVVGDGTGTCAEFAVPLILPDTLKLNTLEASGFPNGRQLTDPVIDVTLAVALLELTGDSAPHAPGALVGVLNPSENDKSFDGAFPFLATPH